MGMCDGNVPTTVFIWGDLYHLQLQDKVMCDGDIQTTWVICEVT